MGGKGKQCERGACMCASVGVFEREGGKGGSYGVQGGLIWSQLVGRRGSDAGREGR